MDWPALARAVVAQRVACGYGSQKALATASGIGLRTITDLEAGERGSYTASTLAKLEKALGWPPGRVRALLDTPEQPAEPATLLTREGIARYVHRDDLPLIELLYRSGLSEADMFRVILKVRAVREQQSADLLTTVAGLVRDLGGHAPDVPYPPGWLVEDGSPVGGLPSGS